MEKWDEKIHPKFGRSLYVDNGVIELIIPLEYGIRIGHFGFINGDNIFYFQPRDMKEFTTEEGWRLRGGHRLWIAPENEDTYYPDNESVSYEIKGDEVVITQNQDPWLGIEKSIRISFCGENSVRVTHRMKNVGKKTITRSLWCVSVVAPGGTEYISLGHQEGSPKPWHRISWWDHTCLGDVRAKYEKEEIIIQHLPIDDRYKIGLAHPVGPVKYINQGIVFEKEYEFHPEMTYPDGDVSFETFFCRYMAEIESLSPLYTLAHGESAEHTETWRLRKL